ncbi:hypothetical protein V8G54_011631 [Vigna mungo]|uniref:Uncharacterized protein n=1 Tax=Vigna mungo TaxID=3915 RepID=A0AAQ3NRN9_VIGMU
MISELCCTNETIQPDVQILVQCLSRDHEDQTFLAIETKLIHGPLTNNSAFSSFLFPFHWTMQDLIKTSQTKSLQTKCLFINVLNAFSTVNAASYANCATSTELSSHMLLLTTLSRAIINRSHFLAFWTCIYVNLAAIFT